jgi:hypothetical protein
MDANIAEQLLLETDDFRGAKLPVDVEGMSSARVCSFINALVARMDADESYLEIGTWKGRTLLSAAINNGPKVCIGCDHFRFWGKFSGPGVVARREFYKNVERYRRLTGDVRFFEMRSRELFASDRLRGPIGVYFYDGDHSFEGTRHGLSSVVPLLSRRAVVLVDDWNDPTIRAATEVALRDAALRVLWQRALPGTRAPDDWWNGLGAFYVEKRPLDQSS